MWKGQVGWPLTALIACLALVYLSFCFERALNTDVARPSTFQLASSSESDLIRPPVIALLFLTTNGLHAPEIWQAWYEDANDFIKAQRPGHTASDFLRGVVHYQSGLNESEIIVPEWLRGALDPKPAESKWGALLPAMQRLISRAVEVHPDATYFIYISETTVPLKSFASIWSSVMADGRSRIDIYCHDHFNGNKKHTQWMMLSKPHAMVLAANDTWAYPKVNWVKGHCRTGVAASDEYWPLKAITHAPNLKVTWDDFWLKGGVELDVACFDAWTFTYWRSFSPRVAHAKMGNYNVKSGHPSSFSDLQAHFVRLLVQMESMWFFRKAEDDLVVKDCYAPLVEYFSQLMGGEDLRKSKTPPPERQAEDCPLKEFLPTLWRGRNEGRRSVWSFQYYNQ